MVTFIMTLVKFKSYHSKAKLLAQTGENFVTVTRITAQIDGLMYEYGKDKSKSAADKILKRLNAITAELESLRRPSDIGLALSGSGARQKLAEHQMDIVLGNWAQAELMRIYMEQDMGRLPSGPTPWRMVRPRVAQFRSAWTLFGRQLRSAASGIDKDIARSEQVRAQLRNAKVQPGLHTEDIKLLSGDHDRMIREEAAMKGDRGRLLKLAEDADAASDALRNLIELRDALN